MTELVIDSSAGKWNYHVFLSFRGEDIRNNFLGHLYAELTRKGINTFRDNKELKGGEEISPTLLKAIRESKISIVVFSENYASSTWCLEELVNILQCRKDKNQLVLPVFFYVEPTDVRNQKGTFGEAIADHEKRFGKNNDKVNNWKRALVDAAGLTGLELKHG
ncbi:TIR-NBS resistance protein [Quillaja saponaria]|uniref:TIR-NBS resistance protein n=1 Tax=Quillaja saponaria TaxID=32244 RepID=A0AAD7LFX9_QUISA|nr:TIR-NBS resistance protein [Quillaja saponaria]